MIFVTLPFSVTLSWLRNRTYHNSLVVNHKLDYLQFGVLIFLQSFDPQSPTCIQHRSHQVSVEPRTYGSRGGCYRRDRQTDGRTDGRTPDRYIHPAPLRGQRQYFCNLILQSNAVNRQTLLSLILKYIFSAKIIAIYIFDSFVSNAMSTKCVMSHFWR